MDDVLHVRKQVTKSGHYDEYGKAAAAHDIQAGEDQRGRNQDQRNAALERVNERAGETGEKSFRHDSLKLDLHRHALAAAMAAILALRPRGHAQLAEIVPAFVAQKPARRLGMKLAVLGTRESRLRDGRPDWRRHNRRRLSFGDGRPPRPSR